MTTSKRNWTENAEIQIFQEYLRIRTDHPDVNYCKWHFIHFPKLFQNSIWQILVSLVAQCVAFLQRQAESLDMTANVYYPHSASRPVVVLTQFGADRQLPSIMLNSHMDVVAVDDKYWSHAPFGAEIDEDGRIFARGTQDMKSVGMQYLAAIRSLKRDGVRLKRNIHVVYTPDEEIGGFTGMAQFVHTNDFKALNVGFCLDEGMASPTDVFPIFYGERYVWGMFEIQRADLSKIHSFFPLLAIKLKCIGTPGHASLFLENTAIEKISFLMEKFLAFRKAEEQRLKNTPALTIGDVTTTNITTIHGGIQQNVVPPEITMTVDVRMSITIDQEQFERDVRDWCRQAGTDVEIEFMQKLHRVEPTRLDDSNPYWIAFEKTIVKDLYVDIIQSIDRKKWK